MQLHIKDTLRKFEIAPTLPFKKSPLGYWKSRSSVTEKSWVIEMSNVAKFYLTPPPTSCDVERLFSTASEIINKRRSRPYLVMQKNCFLSMKILQMSIINGRKNKK